MQACSVQYGALRRRECGDQRQNAIILRRKGIYGRRQRNLLPGKLYLDAAFPGQGIHHAGRRHDSADGIHLYRNNRNPQMERPGISVRHISGRFCEKEEGWRTGRTPGKVPAAGSSARKRQRKPRQKSRRKQPAFGCMEYSSLSEGSQSRKDDAADPREPVWKSGIYAVLQRETAAAREDRVCGGRV